MPAKLTGRSVAWMLDYLRGLGAVRLADPGRQRTRGSCWSGSGRSWQTSGAWQPRRAALT